MTWKLLTETDRLPAAPNQIPFELTDAEKSKAAVYSLDLERQRRERNRRDQARVVRRPRGDGPGAA